MGFRVVTIGLTLLISLISPTAVTGFPAGGGVPLDACVQAATERRIDNWTCVGGMLYFSDPAQVSSAEPRAERIAPDIGSATMQTSAVAAVGSEPDYDTWCENGSVCTTEISDWLSATNGNAAYGNSSGVTGTFDIVLRTNLNGRSARWSVRAYHDSGPALTFSNARVTCIQVGFAQCGSHYADNGDGVFSIGTGNYRGPTIQGNYLANRATYRGVLQYSFQGTGTQPYVAAPLNGQVFDCRSTSSYFE